MSELDRLVALLAKLPGLGPRSARRAALYLLKRRESLMEPLSQALMETARQIRPCSVCGNPDTTDPCAICADPAPRSASRLRRRRRGRSLGARAVRRVQGPLSRARRHAFGARRRRPGRPAHRRARRPRRRWRRARGDPRPERHRRGPDHGALPRRPPRRDRRRGLAPRPRRAGRRRARLSRRRHAHRRPRRAAQGRGPGA